jgi:hypothetical protein
VAQEPWPRLPYAEWKETYATLHLFTQIVGKIRLRQMPWINHSWHVTLYPTARGLTTGPMPCGPESFQIDFDFIDHRLRIRTGGGAGRTIALRAVAVAVFYAEVFSNLAALGLDVRINTLPSEIPDPIRFPEDTTHAAYDPEYANRWWRILLQSGRVFNAFRAPFIGKCSPVHFFWGSFDLAVSRFSGRRAPRHPGGNPHLPDWVTREAYSHEVSSLGFWPGGGPVPHPVFYSYAYPEPAGFSTAPVRPAGAFYSPDFHEFLLPYEDVRTARDPDAVLLEFARSTYDAAADLGAWNRAELERTEEPGPRTS